MDSERFSNALVVGHGRSGTNWLLDLMDLSERTYCRSEPNEIDGAAMSTLPDPRFARVHDVELERCWDAAVHDTTLRMGMRDHRRPPRKTYARRWPESIGAAALVRRPRARRLLSRVLPSLRGGEWDCPAWMFDERRLREALPVIKLVQVPGWGAWAVRCRPRTFVMHIVRHPGGFLNSWRGRYVAKNDPASIAVANRDRLEGLRSAAPAWFGSLGPLDAMSVDETELWYWRYAAEAIHEAGDGRPNYRLIGYEQLVMETAPVLRDMYSLCGLEWSSSVSAGTERFTEKSASIAGAWRERLSAEDIRLVERVLDGSPLASLWGGTA